MTHALTASENRHRDRRQNTPFFCPYHLGIKPGRRADQRRIAETGAARYVDHYSGHLLVCAIAILCLSILDAGLTLNILTQGGEEVNWFMAVLLEDSIEKFFAFKIALTALAIVLLVIHHNVRLTGKIYVRHIKYMILAGYGTLIGYELLLLSVIAA